MVSTNKALNAPANNTYIGTWDVPVNANWASIDSAFGGNVILNPNVVGYTLTLSTAQYIPLIMVIGSTLTASAALSGNVVFTLPAAVGGQWTVYNNTTGPYTVTIASAGGGTSFQLPQGLRTVIACDGVNVFQGTTTSTSNAAGSSGQVQYNKAGALAGSSLLTFNDGTGALGVNGSVSVTGAISVTGASNFNGMAINAAAGSTLGLAAGGSLFTSGAFAATMTFTGATNVTFPTSGTLLSTAGANTYTAVQNFNGGMSATFAAGPFGVGTPSNLAIIQASSGGSTVAVTAKAVYVEDVSHNVIRINNLSATLTLTATGLNGVDTGSVAASNFYYIYAISNGTVAGTIASLTAPDSGGPTLPSGYAYSGFIGVLLTDSSAHVVPFYQYGDDWAYLTQRQFASGASAGSSVSLSGFIPGSRCRSIKGTVNNGNAQSNTRISLTSTSGVIASAAGSGGDGYAAAYFEAPNIGATLYYFASSDSGAAPFAYVNGFKLQF